jgi:hypothetical protein
MPEYAVMRDISNWYASGRSGRLSALAACRHCTAEQAVRLAVRDALDRYQITDWSLWTFTAEEFGFGRQRLLRFLIDPDGEPIRTQ